MKLLAVLTLLPVWISCQTVPYVTVTFDPKEVTMLMGSSNTTNVTVEGLRDFKIGDELTVYSKDGHIANTTFLKHNLTKEDIFEKGFYEFQLEVNGFFIGMTDVHVKIVTKATLKEIDGNSTLKVVVLRVQRLIDKIFRASVIILVSILFINFGCALDWSKVMNCVKRPIGPSIGFLSQFLFMPVISFCLGKLAFPNNAPLQLGMFFTGISPGGSASNIWSLVLGGNLDLSVAMTTISTVAAFGMIPFWLFTLGQHIISNSSMRVPYLMIFEHLLVLVIPLSFGFLSQKKFPKFAAMMVRMMKPFSILLLVFIIIFGVVTNLYLFELFSQQIIFAGMGVPWLGYTFGYLLALIFKQTPEDRLTIALETGIQNTGITVFLLQCLPQPAADLTIIIPVSIAMMTPLPLLLLYFYKTMREKYPKSKPEATVLVNKSSTQDTLA